MIVHRIIIGGTNEKVVVMMVNMVMEMEVVVVKRQKKITRKRKMRSIVKVYLHLFFSETIYFSDELGEMVRSPTVETGQSDENSVVTSVSRSSKRNSNSITSRISLKSLQEMVGFFVNLLKRVLKKKN